MQVRAMLGGLALGIAPLHATVAQQDYPQTLYWGSGLIDIPVAWVSPISGDFALNYSAKRFRVDPVTAKKRGKQAGADYIMSGGLATNVQQVGNDKYIYYKLTMNLTNLEESTIDCTEEREIRKKFRKKRVGL